MKYVVGVLCGLVIAMLALGGYYYIDYLNSYNGKVASKDYPRKVDMPEQKETTSNKRKRLGNVVLYRWYDDGGERRYSIKPPQDRAFSVYTYKPHQTLPSISLPPGNSKQKKRPLSGARISSSEAKDYAIAKNNNPACRIVVGQLHETRIKINRHTGSRPSMLCSDYSSFLRDLYKLREDGHQCVYSASEPNGC